MEGIANKCRQALFHKLAFEQILQPGQPRLRGFEQNIGIRNLRVNSCDDGRNVCPGGNGADIRIVHFVTKRKRLVYDLFLRELVIHLVADCPQQVVHIQKRADDFRALFAVLPA